MVKRKELPPELTCFLNAIRCSSGEDCFLQQFILSCTAVAVGEERVAAAN